MGPDGLPVGVPRYTPGAYYCWADGSGATAATSWSCGMDGSATDLGLCPRHYLEIVGRAPPSTVPSEGTPSSDTAASMADSLA